MIDEEWGNDYNFNIDVARGALKKFGSEALIEKLEKTSMGNDPELIKAFHKIGSMIVEDDVRGGRSSMELNGSSNAMAEIGNLKTNPGFMKQLFDRKETGHDEAKRRWEDLHSMAFAE